MPAAKRKTIGSGKRGKINVPKRVFMGVAALALIAVALPFVQSGVSNVSAGTCNYPGVYFYKPGPAKPAAPTYLNLATELAKVRPQEPNIQEVGAAYYGVAYNMYEKDLANFNANLAPKIKKKVADTNKERKVIYTTQYSAWSKANAKQYAAYKPKLAAYNTCSAKLKAALTKAQAVFNARQADANKAQAALSIANGALDNHREAVQVKNEIYKSFTNPTASQEQSKAQKAYNDSYSARETAKSAVTAAQDNVEKKKAKVQEAQAAYLKSKTNSNLNALNDAKDKLASAKSNLSQKETALQATWQPMKDAEAALAKANNRLALVQKMDMTPVTDPNYTQILKPRMDAQKALEAAERKRDVAAKYRDTKQLAFSRANEALRKARTARDAAQRAYDQR